MRRFSAMRPYASATVAVVESELPGGHSPGYFAVVNSPIAVGGLTWRNDPAAFTGFPDFFLAHELAHQWWGQAVGWKNYHEQWISEGFAQYFAALYAQKTRGDETFLNMLRQFRRWSLNESDEGPVHLGLPARPHQGRQPHLPGAGLQQGRGRPAHAAAVARRRGVLQRAAALLRRAEIPQGGHRRPAPRLRGRIGQIARALLRAVDLQLGAAARPLQQRGRRCRHRRPLRAADEPRFRPAGDRDRDIRERPHAGRRRAHYREESRTPLPRRGPRCGRFRSTATRPRWPSSKAADSIRSVCHCHEPRRHGDTDTETSRALRACCVSVSRGSCLWKRAPRAACGYR